MKVILPGILLMLLSACAASAQPPRHPTYSADFIAEFRPATGTAAGRLTIRQTKGELRRLNFFAPISRFQGFEGDGEVERSGDRLIWDVPEKGGTLSYEVRIDHRRGGKHDARMTDSWVLARLDDLFPAARVRTLDEARSVSSLTLDGPEGWSFETRYGPAHERVPVREDDRRFDRPTGWMVAGDIGIRRDLIADRPVAVAAPVGKDFRRLDVLAFLRWNLPTLVTVFPAFPDQLLIVGAPSDMWRGGLSGPASLYLHADRPLISENATSPLLHELVHVATAHPPADGDDWIVEGLAEFYGLEILRRTGTISAERFERAIEWQADWARREGGQLTDPSTGPDTARAVLLFHALNQELLAAGTRLDSAVVTLFSASDPSRHRLREAVQGLLGRPSAALEAALAEAAQ